MKTRQLIVPDNPVWMEYLQPNGTLKNMLGIIDANELASVEHKVSADRAYHLIRQGFKLPDGHLITGSQFSDVLGVHEYLFNGIYTWAGQFRQVDMTKGSTHFLEASFMYQAVEDEQRRLDSFSAVTSQNEIAVASKLGDAISALNFMHPFREGNGRTQRIIAAAMAATKGYRLDNSCKYRCLP